MVERLIAAGAKIDEDNVMGFGPLENALVRGKWAVAELLIAKGARVSQAEVEAIFSSCRATAKNARSWPGRPDPATRLPRKIEDSMSKILSGLVAVGAIAAYSFLGSGRRRRARLRGRRRQEDDPRGSARPHPEKRRRARAGQPGFAGDERRPRDGRGPAGRRGRSQRRHRPAQVGSAARHGHLRRQEGDARRLS